MNAEQARVLAINNFEEIKNDKINMILDTVTENAKKGKFSAFFEDTRLDNDEERHLRELGYSIKYYEKELKHNLGNKGGRQVFYVPPVDLEVKW